jgi:hypothetical protein
MRNCFVLQFIFLVGLRRCKKPAHSADSTSPPRGATQEVSCAKLFVFRGSKISHKRAQRKNHFALNYFVEKIRTHSRPSAVKNSHQEAQQEARRKFALNYFVEIILFLFFATKRLMIIRGFLLQLLGCLEAIYSMGIFQGLEKGLYSIGLFRQSLEP